MREKTYSFTIEEIPIIVTKKRMKNMYLRISKEDGSVRISAPHQMSDERIYRFAKERIGISSIVKLYVFSLISGLSDNFLNFNMMMLGANSAFTT